MHDLIFTTLTLPGKSELDTLLMAESLRGFGGDLADNPLWVLVPAGFGPLSDPTLERLNQLKTRIFSLESDSEITKFPFATKVLAAAAIEAQVQDQTERLVYLDRDTIMLQEPTELLISAGQALGYRPVHHKLIGSSWDHPPDSFWELIYEVCDVPGENLFPMMTHTQEKIRPYFNAGIFSVRPERGLLAQWRDMFLECCQQPQFNSFYEKNQLYTIFIHQAIFTGVLLHNLKPEETFELNPKINYPLHLHNDIPTDQQPDQIDELVTVRYESIFDESGWEDLPMTESLKNWLKAQPRLQNSEED